MKPIMTNAADEFQASRAEGRVKNRRQQELNDVCKVLATKEGRRFVWKYLEKCRVFSECFDHSGSVTNFNLGSRNIGLILLADINAARPEAYLEMLKESKENDLDE